MRKNPIHALPRAFSLVELLTTLAIVAVLLAVLIPVAQSVRTYSEQSRCVSNLRQIGSGFLLFAAANDNLIPSYRPYGNASTFWDSFISRYMDRSISLLKCPTHQRLLNYDEDNRFTYGMNSTFDGPYMSLGQFLYPSDTFLVGSVGIDAPGSKSRIPAAHVHREPSQMGFLHRNQASILKVDGSVHMHSMESIPHFDARRSSHPDHAQYQHFWFGYSGPYHDGPASPVD